MTKSELDELDRSATTAHVTTPNCAFCHLWMFSKYISEGGGGENNLNAVKLIKWVIECIWQIDQTPLFVFGVWSAIDKFGTNVWIKIYDWI
jgi:hypothetical protein